MHIYFVGIGGAGLSPMAQLALDCGFEVNGSDIMSGLGTDAVEERGVEVSYSQDGESMADLHKIKPIDWVVYTAACKSDHTELEFAMVNNIKFTKRDEFINFVLKEKNLKLIGVAGTHGKTTTTGMMVWIFKQLGIPVSYLVGSNISFGRSAAFEDGSEYFVLEADEFDRNFLKFEPHYSIITNIDYDHPDVYKTEADYFDAFLQYTQATVRSTYMWSEDFGKIVTPNNQIHFMDSSEPNIKHKLDNISLTGLHNRKNGLLCVELVREIIGCEVTDVVSTFPGTQRRMEQLAPNIYSDYAHHPTEISATLQMAFENSENLVVVYQPHQNVRQHEIKHLYKNCFYGVKHVYWLSTYLSREINGLEILSPEYLISQIPDNSNITHSEMTVDLQKLLTEEVNNGSTVIAMGAGDIDKWIRAVSLSIQGEAEVLKTA
jgi:UDP-N-acetylmuramate--alanine ligase